MKFAPLVALFAAAAHGLDTAELLAQLGPVIQSVQPVLKNIQPVLKTFQPVIEKVTCAAPCILTVANNVDACDKGAIATICSSLDQIAAHVGPCVNKCGINKELRQYALAVSKQACASVGSLSLPASPRLE